MRRSVLIASLVILVVGLGLAYVAHHPELVFPTDSAPPSPGQAGSGKAPRPQRSRVRPTPPVAPAPVAVPAWRQGRLRDLGQATAATTASHLGALLGQQATLDRFGDVWGTYRVDWGAGHADILLDGDPWSATSWLPAAQGMMGAVAPNIASVDSAAAARDLLSPTTGVLLALDRSVGESLAADDRNPAAHERAALLAAVLAYRESAGPFYDPRELLAASCAHLTIARACGGGNGDSGLVAEALIRCLAGLETEAVALIDAWPRGQGALDAWARAIRLRSTLDWRAHGVTQEASLVERLAHMLALSVRISAMAALEWLGESPQPAMPDWGRIACQASELSIEAGHIVTIGGLRDEFAELAAVLTDIKGKSEDLPRLWADTAVRVPGRTLPGGMWTRWCLRQLADRLDRSHYFAEHRWGVPDRGKEVRMLAGHALADTPLLAMLRCAWDEAAECDGSKKEVAEILLRHPETVPPGVWVRLRRSGLEVDGRQWFRSAVHADMMWCAEDAAYATNRWHHHGDLRAVLVKAPHHVRAARILAMDLLAEGKVAEAQPLLDGVGRIDISILWQASTKLPGDQRLPYLQMMAQLNPNAFIELGDALLASAREVEAADAYEHAFREASDRVRVANSMRWWIEWLLKRGQIDRAREVAEHGRQVYSHRGLVTYSRFCESTDDLPAAEQALLDLAERYANRSPLRRFWLRTRSSRAASATALEREERQLFPNGRQPATLADFTGNPPTDLIPLTLSDELTAAGIAKGHAVVAVDGWRCASVAQLNYLMDVHTDGPARLIVWQGFGYIERQATTKE